MAPWRWLKNSPTAATACHAADFSNGDSTLDLQLTGKTVLITGASKGIGLAAARAFAAEGCHLHLTARSGDALAQTRDELQSRHGVRVSVHVLDMADHDRLGQLADDCADTDILINNAGVDDNMLTPIELIKATVDGMIARKFGRIVNITSNSVKAPIEELGLSNAARSGLTGFVAGLARKTVRHNVTINNILPGQFMTDRLKTRLTVNAKEAGVTLEQYLDKRSQVIPAGRFGDPNEFGELCAYVCSVQAAFITGQNFLIDGGTYPGTY